VLLAMETIARPCYLRHTADRLDNVVPAMCVAERVPHSGGYLVSRSTPAAAKNALGLRRISYAHLSSRFSRSKAANRAHRSSILVAGPHHAPSAGARAATSLANSRSCRQSTGPQPAASHARPAASGPNAPTAPGLLARTALTDACPSLRLSSCSQSLKARSFRQTRGVSTDSGRHEP
jgi:hypothetical protein